MGALFGIEVLLVFQLNLCFCEETSAVVSSLLFCAQGLKVSNVGQFSKDPGQFPWYCLCVNMWNTRVSVLEKSSMHELWGVFPLHHACHV